jgi:GNAT superfamily N-acetyltransferase
MAFRLQVATPEDRARISNLVAASVRGLQIVDYNPAQIEAALETVFTIDSQLLIDGTYFLVLTESDELVGCGGWSRRKTLYGGDGQLEHIESELLNPATEAARIRAIFVHPDFARMGIGTMLLEAAEQAARDEGFAKFEMGSTLTGVPLYHLRGYCEIEHVMVPVSKGEKIEVVRMEKLAHGG